MPHPNYDDLKYIAVSLYAVAAVVTSLRLYLRARKRSWGWDDSFALLAMLSMAIQVTATFLLANPNITRHAETITYYMLLVGFYIPVWSARLSILFTIIRIAPLPQQRRFLGFCSGFFVLQFVLLTIEAFWICEISHPAWKTIPGALCDLGRPIFMSQVLTTFLSDLILVISPLVILRNIRVDRGIRLRLVSLFAVSLLITIAAITHAVFIIAVDGVIETIAAVVEVFIALAVCNIFVVVPAMFRRFSDKDSLVDSKEYAIKTSGTYHKHSASATMLNTLNVTDKSVSPSLRVRVDVIKEEIRTEDEEWHKHAEDRKSIDDVQDYCGYAK